MAVYKIEIKKEKGEEILKELQDQGYIKIIEKAEPNEENYLEMMARLRRTSGNSCSIDSIARHAYDTKKNRNEF